MVRRRTVLTARPGLPPERRMPTQFERDVAKVLDLFPDAAPGWVRKRLQDNPLLGVTGLADAMLQTPSYEKQAKPATPAAQRAERVAGAAATAQHRTGATGKVDLLTGWKQLPRPVDPHYLAEAERLLFHEFGNVCRQGLRRLLEHHNCRYAPTVVALRRHFNGGGGSHKNAAVGVAV